MLPRSLAAGRSPRRFASGAAAPQHKRCAVSRRRPSRTEQHRFAEVRRVVRRVCCRFRTSRCRREGWQPAAPRSPSNHCLLFHRAPSLPSTEMQAQVKVVVPCTMADAAEFSTARQPASVLTPSWPSLGTTGLHAPRPPCEAASER